MQLGPKDRLAFAQWALERNLSWIAAADAKVAVVVALDTAMLAGLAGVFLVVRLPGAWPILCSIVSTTGIVVAMASAAVSLIPRTNGPRKSHFYFAPIADEQAPDYAANLRGVTLDELLDDVVQQVHRNAQIAARKHLLVRRAILWSFLSAIPWVAAIAILTLP